jgi:hypothetical protein
VEVARRQAVRDSSAASVAGGATTMRWLVSMPPISSDPEKGTAVLLKPQRDHLVAGDVWTLVEPARCGARRSMLPAGCPVHGTPGDGVLAGRGNAIGSGLHRQSGWCGAPLMLRPRERNERQPTPGDSFDQSRRRVGGPGAAVAGLGVGAGGGRFGGYRAVHLARRRIGC